ncbi:MAG: hypothetical protein LBK96_03345 [Prevotellaceae bacterium]|jgi:hypothetical protein|nr:hypothetical protein [Prevotellaceae bacterium]
MYRDKIKELIEWKLSEYRNLGAKQVGKTWLIQEFGKQEYKQTITTSVCETGGRVRSVFRPSVFNDSDTRQFELHPFNVIFRF